MTTLGRWCARTQADRRARAGPLKRSEGRQGELRLKDKPGSAYLPHRSPGGRDPGMAVMTEETSVPVVGSCGENDDEDVALMNGQPLTASPPPL